MHSGGETIVLQAGHYQAKIVTVGAGLAELTHGGRHVVIPHKPEEMPLAHLGKVLIPWPNRVAQGRYIWQGNELQLPVNDVVSNSAIHGLLAWRNWQVSHQSSSEVVLTIFLPPCYGFPFALVCETRYQLDASRGLQVTLCSQNAGDTSAPYGAGAHPYITCNLQSINGCELTLPAGVVSLSRPGFRSPGRLGDTTIDDTFSVPATKEQWEVSMCCPSQKMSTFLRSDQPWLQLYTGEKLQRRGLAVEPMSCPPNAFNTGNSLVHLAPGEEHRLHFSIGCD